MANTSSTLVPTFSSKLDAIFWFLEVITEEAFWERLLGARLINLAKRYFGNDIVFLSTIFYVSSILRTHWQTVLEFLIERWRSQQVRNYVYVELNALDVAFPAIDFYVRRQTKEIHDLTRVVATYDDSAPVEDEDKDEASRKPVMAFYPPEETTSTIEYKGHTLWVTRKSSLDESSDSEQMLPKKKGPKVLEISMESDSLSTLKGILQEWADMYNEKKTTGVNVYKYSYAYCGGWSVQKTLEPRSIDTVTLRSGLKERILRDMETFRRRKLWYKTRGVPYRRGYLLYGPPGTGKSSLIQALASKLNMDIAILSILDVHTDSEFNDLLCEVPNNTFVVLEDFDHYFNSDLKLGGTRDISVAGILNALDGIQGQSGTMIFMTCNDISKLPPALLRPGRMDLKLKLDYADRGQVEDMFWQFFGLDPDTLEPISDSSRKASLEQLKTRFGQAIPDQSITTAELENLFISVWMEADPQNPDEGIYERLFDRIPEFLEKVKLDREQARLHEERELRAKRRKRRGSSSSQEEDDTEDNGSTCSDEEVHEDTVPAAKEEPETVEIRVDNAYTTGEKMIPDVVEIKSGDDAHLSSSDSEKGSEDDAPSMRKLTSDSN